MCFADHKTFSGYDYEFLIASKERLNFHLDLNYLKGNEMWGTILNNGSTTGALDVLRRGEADVGIGNYFLRKNRLDLFDVSNPYYSTPLVIVIPPGNQLNFLAHI